MQPITIIIPTIAGREASLAQVIAGLEAQTVGAGAFQVIIIQDGEGMAPPEPSTLSPWLRVLSHERRRGLAAARNTAVASVETELAMFIDDDIIPAPGVIEAHLAFHRRHRDPLVMGAGEVTWKGHPHYNGLMDWNEHQSDWSIFRSLRPDQCFPYLVGGFTSFWTETIRTLRFNETFTRYGCEDHELGYRFFRRGGRLRFVDQAPGLHLKVVTAASLYREMRQGIWSKWLFLPDYPDLVGTPTGLITAVQMERQGADPDVFIRMLDQFAASAHNRMAVSTDLLIRFLFGLAHCHGLMDFWKDRFPGFEAAAEHVYRGYVAGEMALPEALEAALAACPTMPWIRLYAARHTQEPALRIARLEQILEAHPSYALVFLERLEQLSGADRIASEVERWTAAHLAGMERSSQQATALACGRILARHGLDGQALEHLQFAAEFECWDEGQLRCARQAWRELALRHERRGEADLAASCRARQFQLSAGTVRELKDRLQLCGPHETLLAGHLGKWLALLGEPEESRS